jgi:protein SCO1/2
MKRKTIFYTLFFVVLFTGFYYAMKVMIPGYADVKLPVLSYVKPFRFTSQDNQPVTLADLRGKVYVAEYFFTTCKGICPKLNSNMKTLYTDLKNEPDFMIVSHTVDPETDSPVRLKVYADSLGVSSSRWLFLTGSKDSLYKAARVSYLLDDPRNGNDKIENQFIHTQFFALVDRNGRVRKIYDGLKKDELDQLEKDVPALLKESTSSGNNMFSNNPG